MNHYVNGNWFKKSIYIYVEDMGLGHLITKCGLGTLQIAQITLGHIVHKTPSGSSQRLESNQCAFRRLVLACLLPVISTIRLKNTVYIKYRNILNTININIPYTPVIK